MEYSKFSLGLRFAMTKDAALTPERCWEILFSEVPTTYTENLRLFGKWDDTAGAESEAAYICMFSNLPLGVGKELYAELLQKHRLLSYLTIYRPFVQNNLVEKSGVAEYVGQVGPDGAVTGGDAAYGPMRFTGRATQPPEKNGLRPRILIAPAAWEGVFTSADAARHMMRLAAERLPNAAIGTQLVADGGAGTLDALVCSLKGRYLRAELEDGEGGKTEFRYGILPDRTLVFETEALSEEQTEQALALPRNRGYRAYVIAAGGGAVPKRVPDGLDVTVLTGRVPADASSDATLRYGPGVQEILEASGFFTRLQRADWLIVLTRLMDRTGSLLGTTADTLLYHGRGYNKRAAVLAFSGDGKFYAKIGADAPEPLDSETFDEAAGALFERVCSRTCREPAARACMN